MFAVHVAPTPTAGALCSPCLSHPTPGRAQQLTPLAYWTGDSPAHDAFPATPPLRFGPSGVCIGGCHSAFHHASQTLLVLSLAALPASREKLRLPRIWLPLALFIAGTLISLILSPNQRLCYLLRFNSTQLSLMPTASHPSSPSLLRPLTSKAAAPLRSIRSALTTWYSQFCRACAEVEAECHWPTPKAPRSISVIKTTFTSMCNLMDSYLPSTLQTDESSKTVQDVGIHQSRAAC